MPSPRRSAARLFPWHYAWAVAGIAFLAMLFAAGVRAVPAVLMVPLEAEFNWDRTVVSAGVALNILLFGLCGPFAASVMERVGMRAMMIGGLVVMACAVAAATAIQTAWQFTLVWGLVVGIGSGVIAGWVAAAVANRWFVARRGLVVGLLTAANATGQLIFLPILAAIAGGPGWRISLLLVVACLLVILPLVAIGMRERPGDLGLRAYGAPSTWWPPPSLARVNLFLGALRTLASGLRHRDFLLLAGTFFICGASTNGLVGTHLISHSIEHGIAPVAAASFLSIVGIFDIVGTIASGWLTDRFDSRLLLAWYYGLRGISLVFLPQAYEAGLTGLTIFAIFYGLDWVATVPPTVQLTAAIFGRERVATHFAWIVASHQIGAAAIAYLAGLSRVWQGNYGLAFLVSGLLCLLAAWMATRIARGASAPVATSPAAA